MCFLTVPALVCAPGEGASDAEPALSMEPTPTAGGRRTGRPKGDKCSKCSKRQRLCGPACADWPGHQLGTTAAPPPAASAIAGMTPPALATPFADDAAQPHAAQSSAAASHSADGQGQRRRMSRNLDAEDPEWSGPRRQATGKRNSVVAAASIRASTAQEPPKRLKPRNVFTKDQEAGEGQGEEGGRRD